MITPPDEQPGRDQAETPTRASREPATREYCKAPLDIDRSFKNKNGR